MSLRLERFDKRCGDCLKFQRDDVLESHHGCTVNLGPVSKFGRARCSVAKFFRKIHETRVCDRQDEFVSVKK